jgi:hypothetical protein
VLAARKNDALVIASVTGTDADRQSRADQVRTLVAAGVTVAESNADAAATAIAALARGVGRHAGRLSSVATQ